MKKILLALVVVFGLFQLQGGHLDGLLGSAPATGQSHLSAQEQELYNTLERIRQNGPYPYQRDGITFENRERLLPIKPRGYYREFTVDTPGLSHRGPRRVVTGGNPPEVFYYTEDHYRSFRRIQGYQND
ncbi:ribonuclease domain-containing protein [Marinobacterium iners]|uniref:Ribonuclease n=1 Tax=Marinobacterium iners DSM 11526 TaxID=1122198 RepID=A0A1H4GY37_9GAMM|nr:ribonuclease domain-containing protein [Marinobacterium iners]SEB14476.1 ribonuclease [Marinobacterium iners DSM 11526]